MADRGAEVAVVSAAGDVAATEVDGLRVFPVPTVDLARYVGAEIAVAPSALRVAARAAAELHPHVLHANHLMFQTSLAAALLAPRLGLPLVSTAHLGPLTSLRAGLRLPATVHERSVGRFILRRSRRVIAVSSSVAAHLRHLRVDAARIDVVPNGVDHERFHPPAAGRPPAGTDRPPAVVFVGRLVANKGPALFVEALGALAAAGVGFTATVVGDGPLRARLEAHVVRLGLAGRVSFSGEVTDVADRLREADIMVRPSLTEGLPLTVLEAMASGACVLASDIPGNAELIVSGASGLLFRPGDAGDLARQLKVLIADPVLRRRLAGEGCRRAAAYSWDATADATARVLTGVAGVPTHSR
jgi:glycosyltransferase involved in cell wall biosynthesis